jgi:predicted dehydrogenase/NADPH:quinone reductase-like Zn-dependent oxidoreductase
MEQRARALAISGIDATLSALGFRDGELEVGRADVVDWGRARIQAWHNRAGVVRGSRISITGRGRAELKPFDQPLAGADEVTVEVLASAVSPGTERAQWLRLPNAQPAFPYSPGYSVAGRVFRAGAAARVGEGQLVAVPRVPHASVATVPAAWAAPVPDGVEIADASLVYLAIISGYGVERAGLRAGDSLCVIGAGPIGALAQRLAMLRGPADVTVVASSRRREGASIAAGADTFHTVEDDLDGIQAAIVIEATGDPAALGAAVESARPGGTVVLLGSPRGRTPAAVLAGAQDKGLRLVGAHISALASDRSKSSEDPFQALAGTFLSALADGSLNVADLAGDPLDPREGQLSYRRLARGEVQSAHYDWTRLPEAERIQVRSLLSGPALRRGAGRLRLPGARRPRGSSGRIRFALIGCGDIGLHNARAIAAARNAELALCHDPVAELAEAAADKAGGEVASDLEAALDPKRVDAVCVCTPHHLHAPLVEAAAAAGLHIVVEKPLANDLAEAQRAVDAATGAGVELSVCFPYRYEPAMQAARALVRDGALGEPHGANVVFHMDKPESYWVGGFSGRAASDWRSSRDRAGGGVLIMNVAHYVDFIRHIGGMEPMRVSAVARSVLDREVEDFIAITVEFDGGAVGTISASASTRGALANRFELWGEVGTLRLEPEPAVFSERALGGLPAGRWCALPPESDTDPRVEFFERFGAAVLAGSPVDATAADGLAVQAFVEAAYRSAEQGTSVAIEDVQAAGVG